ncbi:hypothetical protein [Caballeronia glebae]|uniref:hypothetical protein n=1 Tax=Caballeronia glebae TaxID=1777143 RepID=UPI001F18B9B6|nr:hypothetical protein [Caballeronia glebae]
MQRTFACSDCRIEAIVAEQGLHDASCNTFVAEQRRIEARGSTCRCRLLSAPRQRHEPHVRALVVVDDQLDGVGCYVRRVVDQASLQPQQNARRMKACIAWRVRFGGIGVSNGFVPPAKATEDAREQAAIIQRVRPSIERELQCGDGRVRGL